jgi:3-hydroxyacyl-[acyl-carrier-protein] dehydratase|tara:strand:- start:86 stop:532 length:447 start_codon:yes stop_codon:yes gene_type:complete
MTEKNNTMTIEEIEATIPHRYPFLLVDMMKEVEEGKRGIGIKNVTANEWFFEGHFPERKVMPGVLIVEALAQVACITMLRGIDSSKKVPLFGGIEKMRFRKPVVPGDTLHLKFTLTKQRRELGWGEVEATVNGEVAAIGTISFALVDR